jgi:hypothetical protein
MPRTTSELTRDATMRSAEQADHRLRAAWAAHLKSRASLQSTKAVPRVQSNVLLAPEVEKQNEALVPPPQRQSLARTTKAEFVEPAVVRSSNGELRVTLTGAFAHNRIGADPVYLRAFNGKLVGPSLRVKPGDKILLTLKNRRIFALPGYQRSARKCFAGRIGRKWIAAWFDTWPGGSNYASHQVTPINQ